MRRTGLRSREWLLARRGGRRRRSVSRRRGRERRPWMGEGGVEVGGVVIAAEGSLNGSDMLYVDDVGGDGDDVRGTFFAAVEICRGDRDRSGEGGLGKN